MGKASKVKKEVVDVKELVELIQVLKDVATNKFFTLLNQKERFARFGESFVEFFRMISLSKVRHPLISNDNPTVGVLVVTADGSFLGEFNNKVLRLAIAEKEKHEKSIFIAVGEKGVIRLSNYQKEIKAFLDMEMMGLYETAVAIKDYLIEEVMNDRLGKVLVVYSWPKSFEEIKPRGVKLLPCEELVSKQANLVEQFERIIEESDPVDLIGMLADMWLTTRLYEILFDTVIAAAASQAKKLEESLDKMKKERAKVFLKYRKAKKTDIDSGLREVFSARMVGVN